MTAAVTIIMVAETMIGTAQAPETMAKMNAIVATEAVMAAIKAATEEMGVPAVAVTMMAAMVATAGEVTAVPAVAARTDEV